jgi:AraC-like DNA-binding protein
MPSTIRETLGDRLRQLPGLQSMLEDLRVATGLPATFVSALGHRQPDSEVCALCRHLQSDAAGARLCNRNLQALLERAAESPASMRCDAGLVEAAVPLRMGGHTFGYIVFGHCAPRAPTRVDLNHTRHLLARVGLRVPEEVLEKLAADAPVMPPERLEALLRLVTELAERLVLEITEHIIHPPTAVPPLVERASRLIRAEYAQPLALTECARRLGVSSGHLSRSFHHSTGLRFVEYLSRVRADHARRRLVSGNESITEIAFACGFQSLSQFHRTIRAQFGQTPGELRRQALQASPRPPA